MKKIMIGLLALAMVFGFNSCKQSTPSLEELAASAKTEGANWSIDEWKDAFKNAMTAVSPMLLEAQELQKKAEEDPDKALEILGTLAQKQEEWKALGDQLDAFMQAAEASENGKKVLEDEEFQMKLFKDLGIDPDMLK